MKEVIVKQIDKRNYQITQFMTSKSISTLKRLGQIVGEPLGVVFALAQDGEDDSKREKMSAVNEAALIGNVVKTLFDKFDEKDGQKLIEDLSSGDTLLCNNQNIDFESHYQGELGHLIKVVMAVLEVQYGNFLGEIVGLVKSRPDLASQLTNQKT